MKNEPKIRIKGFEGEWKAYAFDNIVDRISSYSSSNRLPTVEFEDILSGENRLNKDVYSKPIHKGGIAFEKNDVLFGKLRPYLKNILFATFNGIAVGDFWVLRANESNPAFIYTLVNNKRFMDVANISSGSKMPRADWNLVSKYKFLIPKISEQRAIATYFRHLDSVIETADKKLASLKQVKEASLQTMFPQEGQSVPKVRFKGFEGEWKTSLLKDISQKVTEKNVNLQYKVTLTNSAEYGVIDQLDFFDHKISKGDNIRNYYIVRDRDFVYNPRISVSAPVGPINQNLLGYAGVMSPLYYVFRVHDIDECYLSYFFKTKLWHSFMKDNGNSGARFDRLSITDDVFERMPIIHPNDIAEQRAIASFFVHLDKQIEIAQQRLALLRRIKSACLDEMFV